ncbi:MAG: 3'-5' exonuclease [Alphaproteobacteria bacterium]
MLARLPLPRLFLIAAIVTMLLAAGAVWQFEADVETMLRALVPSWIGIAAVFWVLWRQIAPAGADPAEALPPRPLTTDFAPLRLDRRYADLSGLGLDALDYVVVDTETTGLKPHEDEIVQIGAVRVTGGKVLEGESFERLVNPGRPIPPASIRFHGVTDEMVAHAPGIEEILHEFAEFAGDAVLIGHNIVFDLAFMNRTRRLENPTLDTMLLSIGAFPDRRGHTLEDLSALYDEPVRDRHTALGDADLTARLFLRMQGEFDRLGIRSFGDAQSVCEDAARRVAAQRAHR